MIATQVILAPGVPKLTHTAGNNGCHMKITTGISDLVVGGSDVTAALGFPLAANITHDITLTPGEKLYLLSTGGGRCRCLYTEK